MAADVALNMELREAYPFCRLTGPAERSDHAGVSLSLDFYQDAAGTRRRYRDRSDAGRPRPVRCRSCRCPPTTLNSSTWRHSPPITSAGDRASPERLMQKRRLGLAGPEVSLVGLGTDNFGGRTDLAASRLVVDKALDLGVTLIDTADIYGNKGGSEECLGQILGPRRKNVVLATKFGLPMDNAGKLRGASQRYVMRRPKRVAAPEDRLDRSLSAASPRRANADRRDLACPRRSEHRQEKFASSAAPISPPRSLSKHRASASAHT